MQIKKLAYTILSVLALIIVVLGMIFAWKAYDNENNNTNQNNTLNK